MKIAVLMHYAQSSAGADKVAHRNYLRSLLEQDCLFAAGPLTEESGALLIVEVATVEAVESLVKADPYHAAGLIERWESFPLQYWSSREWKGK